MNGACPVCAVLCGPSLPQHMKRRHGTTSRAPVDSVPDTNSECTLLGTTLTEPTHRVMLNTHLPFVCVTVGVQGAGKSHTLACLLESCLIPHPAHETVQLRAPMTALALHYDTNPSSACEVLGLLRTSPAGVGLQSAQTVILVSPSFYHQRKAFYGPKVCVRPLLFRWESLGAEHIKHLMRIRDGDNQLYIASMMDMLRHYQRVARLPSFEEFRREVQKLCQAQGQSAPLKQRLLLLSSFVAESRENRDLSGVRGDLDSSCAPGTLVIVDLTDPLLAAEDANAVFQVLTEQFRCLPGTGGKVLAIDEAHKFMTESDGLTTAIVNCARLVRHDGMRLIISTQSPLTLAPELLELTTVTVIHRFHSRDWFTFLARKVPLSDDAWSGIPQLPTGEALVYSEAVWNHLRIRPRLTRDLGCTKLNVTQ